MKCNQTVENTGKSPTFYWLATEKLA